MLLKPIQKKTINFSAVFQPMPEEFPGDFVLETQVCSIFLSSFAGLLFSRVRCSRDPNQRLLCFPLSVQGSCLLTNEDSLVVQSKSHPGKKKFVFWCRQPQWFPQHLIASTPYSAVEVVKEKQILLWWQTVQLLPFVDAICEGNTTQHS